MTQVDTLLVSILEGRRLDGLVLVDGHSHIGRNFNLPRARCDVSALVRTMDAVGVARSCVSSSVAIGPDVRRGNEEVAEALVAYPSRIVGAAVVNPRYPREVQPELERAFLVPGMAMIKLHPESHAYPIDGPGYESVFAFATRMSVPVLIHTWGEGRGYDHPRQVQEVATAFPNVDLIMAHAGGNEAGVVAATRIAAKLPNVYLDTATSLVYRGVVQYLLQEAGPEKVVFGSDATYLSLAPQVAKVVVASRDMSVLHLVLGGNLQRLLSRSGRYRVVE